MLGSLNGGSYLGNTSIDCKFKLILNAIKDIRSVNDKVIQDRLLNLLEEETAESLYRIQCESQEQRSRPVLQLVRSSQS
jgi:hypothetical protein